MRNNYKHTKVVYTSGPASESPEMLEKLITEGVDICRLNMAHASYDEVRDRVGEARKVCEKVGRQIAFLMDIKGPEIRSGKVEAPIELTVGQEFTFFMTAEAQAASDEVGCGCKLPSLRGRYRNRFYSIGGQWFDPNDCDF